MQSQAGLAHPTLFDYITLLAIVVGPVLALWMQRILDIGRDKKKAKQTLYFNLMRHRDQWYHVERIQALNSIEVVFSSDKKVLAKWKEFVDHARTKKPTDEAGKAEWNATLDTTLCDLYQVVGNSVGYHFDLKQIKQGAYLPQLHSDLDNAQVTAWFGLAQALEGGALAVRVHEGEPLSSQGAAAGADNRGKPATEPINKTS
jgi:hypothetical protein